MRFNWLVYQRTLLSITVMWRHIFSVLSNVFMLEWNYIAFQLTDICCCKRNILQLWFWPFVFTVPIELLYTCVILWQISISQRTHGCIRLLLWKTNSTFGLGQGMICPEPTIVCRNCGRPPTSMSSSAGWGCEWYTVFARLPRALDILACFSWIDCLVRIKWRPRTGRAAATSFVKTTSH